MGRIHYSRPAECSESRNTLGTFVAMPSRSPRFSRSQKLPSATHHGRSHEDGRGMVSGNAVVALPNVSLKSPKAIPDVVSRPSVS